jgi:hypothetical protein
MCSFETVLWFVYAIVLFLYVEELVIIFWSNYWTAPHTTHTEYMEFLNTISILNC